MFNGLKIHSGARSFAVFAATLALSSCIESQGVVSKTAQTIGKTQTNCLLPDTASVRNIASWMTASAVDVGSDFCAKPEGYECYVRKFSPTGVAGAGNVEERAHVAELGGDFLVKLESRVYNTREAASAPGVSAASTVAGGEYNHSEYVCHQRELRDGDNFLAVGDGESLNEALIAAHGDLAPGGK